MSLLKGRYIKAVVLAVVFSMNSLVSFGCSISSYLHSFHHSITAVKGGSQKLHHHGHGNVDHHHDHSSSDKPGDDSVPQRRGECCSAKVMAIDLLDKTVSRSIDLPFLGISSSVPASGIVVEPGLVSEDTPLPQHLRWRLPATIQDLRIVIQSFQI